MALYVLICGHGDKQRQRQTGTETDRDGDRQGQGTTFSGERKKETLHNRQSQTDGRTDGQTDTKGGMLTVGNTAVGDNRDDGVELQGETRKLVSNSNTCQMAMQH